MTNFPSTNRKILPTCNFPANTQHLSKSDIQKTAAHQMLVVYHRKYFRLPPTRLWNVIISIEFELSSKQSPAAPPAPPKQIRTPKQSGVRAIRSPATNLAFVP